MIVLTDLSISTEYSHKAFSFTVCIHPLRTTIFLQFQPHSSHSCLIRSCSRNSQAGLKKTRTPPKKKKKKKSHNHHGKLVLHLCYNYRCHTRRQKKKTSAGLYCFSFFRWRLERVAQTPLEGQRCNTVFSHLTRTWETQVRQSMKVKKRKKHKTGQIIATPGRGKRPGGAGGREGGGAPVSV